MNSTERQFEILEDIACGRAIETILEKLVELIEDQLPGSRCSILVLDQNSQVLRTAVAPNLPEAYNKEVDGLPLGPRHGCCGAAAFYGEPVMAADIATDPHWKNYRPLAEQHGLVACWSTPIFSQRTTGPDGTRPVLGTFGVYPKEKGLPTEEFSSWMARAQHLACIALETDRVNRKLKANETRFRNVVDHASDAILLFDQSGRIVDLNQKACEHLQYEPEELIGERAGRFDLRSAHQRFLTDAAEEEFSFESIYLRKDGSTYPVDVRVRGFRSDEKEYQVAIVRDITERRRTEATLARQRELLLESQELAGLGHFEWDLSTGNLTWSDTLCRIYGVDPTTFEPTLENFMQRVHPEDRDNLQSVIQNALKKRSNFRNEERILRPNGTIRILESYGKVQCDDRGEPTHIVGACLDVTDRKRMEKHLSESQKMEAVGRLAGGVAHDFNNLLTVINGHAARLAEGPLEAELTGEAVEDILDAGRRAAGLTAQLLSFSRGQYVESTVVDLNQVVRESAKLARRLVGENIDLKTELDSQDAPIEIDPNQLEQILMNLVVNGRDALADGGTLRISSTSSRIVEEPRYSSTSTILPGRYVELCVEDNGKGIEPEVLPNIFEPFFTTKEVGQGSGLGLAVVHGVVSRWSGHIEVLSTPGSGTTFKILFPRSEQSYTTKVLESSSQSGGGEGTILVVEDEESVRRLVARVLTREGYTVLLAGEAESALELADAHNFDLLLTDMVMPGMGGPALADRIREKRPTLPILLMSGYTKEVAARENLDKGQGFLAKPFSPQQLRDTVREMLSQYQQTSGVSPGRGQPGLGRS